MKVIGRALREEHQRRDATPPTSSTQWNVDEALDRELTQRKPREKLDTEDELIRNPK